MPDSIRLDALDRGVAAALQLNGRASWRQVAQAVGASESTVTRRGQQLLADRVVAVTGVLDHLRCGLGISIHLRLRVRPGRAGAVARAIARHRRPRFVGVLTGSYDVAAEVVVPHHRDITTVISDVDALEDVVETESMVVIRKFSAIEEWDPLLLDGTAVDLLRSSDEVTDFSHRDWTEPERLSEAEFAVARVLAENGRATYASIAHRVGTSESTVARRVESLVQRGCLRFRAVFETSALGMDVEYMLWLEVEPRHLEEVGERLAKHPATRYVAASTGRHNLVLHGVLRSYGDLYPYTTETIGQLPGLRSADLTLLVQVLKRAWVPIGADGRVERPGDDGPDGPPGLHPSSPTPGGQP